MVHGSDDEVDGSWIERQFRFNVIMIYMSCRDVVTDALAGFLRISRRSSGDVLNYVELVI